MEKTKNKKNFKLPDLSMVNISSQSIFISFLLCQNRQLNPKHRSVNPVGTNDTKCAPVSHQMSWPLQRFCWSLYCGLSISLIICIYVGLFHIMAPCVRWVVLKTHHHGSSVILRSRLTQGRAIKCSAKGTVDKVLISQ